MKYFLGVIAAAGTLLVAGCGHSSDSVSSDQNAPLPGTTNAASTGTPDQGAQPQTTTDTVTTSEPASTSTSAPASTTPPPKTASTPKPATNYPMATPIPGKKGFVKSPYAPYAEPVDVRAFAPGDPARCPYTNKIFIVPPT